MQIDNPNIWEHVYTLNGQKKKYKTELINYHPDDYNPDEPSEFINIRTELDKGVKNFLDAYHVNPLIPMRVDISGKIFKLSMVEGDSVIIEKLAENVGPEGYGHK
jgi:hypothetical protein